MRVLIDERPPRVARNLSVEGSFSQERVGGGRGGKLLLSTVLAPPRAYQFLTAAVFRPTLDSLSLSSLKLIPVTHCNRHRLFFRAPPSLPLALLSR